MIRNLCITAVLLGLILIGARLLLRGPNLIAFAEHLPGSDTAPELVYYTGRTYYITNDLDIAGAYFKYVYSQYPMSAYAERAHLYWLECRGQQLYKSPAESLAECKAFLLQYPESPYAQSVRKLQEVFERALIH